MNKMARAYDLAAIAVRERLALQTPQRHEALCRLQADDVSVNPGTYDSAEEVLKRLKVPHRTGVSAKGLAKAKILFANCSSSASHALKKNAEPFVRDGGWLISTDWSLRTVVQPSFPGTIAHSKGHSSADEVVGVEPNNDSLWSGVVVLGADPQWWLEAASYPIAVLDHDKVDVEAASHEMMIKYQAPVVSARFAWGAGNVYHVISHLWLKRTRVPQARHYQKTGGDFLRAGMRLNDDSIAKVLEQAGVDGDSFDFATLQSAVTTTELTAQLCIEAALS